MVYFDNAATTPICAEAASACADAFETYGNPSSVHTLGLDAKLAMRADAGVIEKILSAAEGTFHFTSGATEANNWAVFGASGFNPKKIKHIITSKTEHASVLEPVREMEKRGARVTYVNVDNGGNLDLDELFGAINNGAALVSIMAINNETGTINDISLIGNRIKQINENTIFHVDGVCAFCKLPINVNTSKIDLFSLSGHKIHAPKGIGGLYIRPGTKIKPLIYGGGQQKNMRSGTESTPLISALAAAASAGYEQMEENARRVSELKNMLKQGVLELGAEINGAQKDENASPYILNAGFRWIKSQIMVNALEQRGIYASAGSACLNNKAGKTHSGVLAAMNIENGLIEGAVRFSLSKFSTVEDVNICINALRDIHDKYRGLL